MMGDFGNLLTRQLDAESTGMGGASGVFATGSTYGNITYVYSQYFLDIGSKDGISFDASRSSPIYGRSDTVQPASLFALPLIKF